MKDENCGGCVLVGIYGAMMVGPMRLHASVVTRESLLTRFFKMNSQLWVLGFGFVVGLG